MSAQMKSVSGRYALSKDGDLRAMRKKQLYFLHLSDCVLFVLPFLAYAKKECRTCFYILALLSNHMNLCHLICVSPQL